MSKTNSRILRLQDAKELFILDCQSRRLTRSTLSFYKHRLGTFVTWCNERQIETLADIDTHTIKRFLVHCQGRNLSDQYQHGLARAVKAFMRYCERDGLMSSAPKVVMPKLERRILTALAPDEVKKILAVAPTNRDKAIIFTLLDTGLRASELCALTVADLDFDTGTITVKQGKGQKQRLAPIGTKARKAVRRYLLERPDAKPTEPLFASQRGGKHLRLDGLVQMMERLGAKSGVEHCTAHTFRRTFAITCLRNGMNIHILARIMGHSDISVLRQYLDFVESDITGAHEKASPADNL